MSAVRKIKDAVQNNLVLRRALFDPFMMARFFLPTAHRAEWVKRTHDVLTCPDLADIPRTAGAGTVRGRTQLMHNGLRIVKNSYYGYSATRMMRLSGGVHEPQEEKAFGLVLPYMLAGAVMLELGAYWGFYSMWFNLRVPQARNFLIEPIAINLDFGRMNFALNNMQGSFHQAFIGKTSNSAAGSTPTICVDDFVRDRGIDFVHMLHSDVQGYEMDMLQGSRQTFAANKVGYAFVSTHDQKLHDGCLKFLKDQGLKILTDATPAQSYSYDGLIVGRSEKIDGPEKIEISKKPSSSI
jgi:hypothetical protein